MWWVSTGLILWVNRRPGARLAATVAAFAVLALSLLAIHLSRDQATAGGAYVAFLAAIGVWGFNEMVFLAGLVTGPRTTAAPPAGGPVSRLRAATEAILYHELALALSLAAVAALSLGGANRVALATFAILWVMRLSAKLNVYLGVRNLSEDFLPAHLAYLETYFRREPMNPLLPFSVAAGLVAAGLIFNVTWRTGADPYTIAGGTLCATLLLLAVIEHLFMIAPVPLGGLWRWANAPAPSGRGAPVP